MWSADFVPNDPREYIRHLVREVDEDFNAGPAELWTSRSRST